VRMIPVLFAGVLLPILTLGLSPEKNHKKEKKMEIHTIMLEGKSIPVGMQVLLSPQEIQRRVSELGMTLSTKFADKQPVVIGVLTGASVFHTDLIRAMSIPLEIDFLRVSSYEGTETSGKVQSVLGVKTKISDRHVILVEDIVDTGHTMNFLLTHFKSLSPASITVVTLLFKPSKLLPKYKNSVVIDYAGFEIPPTFVVGYGLDYDGFFRNLSSIYQVKTIQGKSVE
jgi:hypoxanthine phosphoribosyltransferase